MTMRSVASQDSLTLPLSTAGFERVAAVAKAGWGLNLDPAKRPLIETRLSRRMQMLGLSNYLTYCDLVEGGNPEEQEHFVTALTTNVTHFYREQHHFAQIEKEILPELLSRAKAGGRVRIWSAGCSSGQEPYSIAASVLAVMPEARRFDVKILATDIDPTVLRKAEAGVYSASDRSFPTSELERRVFARGTSPDSELMPVRSELREMVTFRALNLVAPWPISGRFDVIFCRNVVIYFDKPTQSRLWSRFADSLNPGGTLFIGHSERMENPSQLGFDAAGITAYRLSNPVRANSKDKT
jgi:chemotaxis protein methyltransferase CheR